MKAPAKAESFAILSSKEGTIKDKRGLAEQLFYNARKRNEIEED